MNVDNDTDKVPRSVTWEKLLIWMTDSCRITISMFLADHQYLFPKLDFPPFDRACIKELTTYNKRYKHSFHHLVASFLEDNIIIFMRSFMTLARNRYCFGGGKYIVVYMHMMA